MGEMRNLSKILVKHEGKRLLGRPGYRWEENIKILNRL
jgi:hypothetical protein